jgi:hypothetical protein
MISNGKARHGLIIALLARRSRRLIFPQKMRPDFNGTALQSIFAI